MERRAFIAALLVGIAAAGGAGPARAHHRPGHGKGKKPPVEPDSTSVPGAPHLTVREG